MNPKALLERFRTWRNADMPMVLALVIEAAGSTYAKPGAMMLIGKEGIYQGLLSGGCLEGDLMSRAEPVFTTGENVSVVYDMRDQEEDQLWGLGLGCGGMMVIRLLALDPANDYFPLGAIDRAIEQQADGRFAVLVNANTTTGIVTTRQGSSVCNLSREEQTKVQKLLDDAKAPHIADSPLGELFVAPIPTPIRLLILGAGPDALPLVELAQAQGWQVQVADHRPAYEAQFSAAGGPAIKIVDPNRLRTEFDLDDFDAAVVMSHHLNTDRLYLQALAGSQIPYVGSLGPPDRRKQLLDDLKADLGNVSQLTSRLYAPIGLDIGARGPEGIALSICAEIHGVLCGNGAGHLGAPQS